MPTLLEVSSLLDFCNPALKADQGFSAICQALDPQLQSFTTQCQNAKIFSALNNQPEWVLDFIALWHFNVDYYDTTLPKGTKLQLIENCIQDKINKGTPARVIQILTTVFGYAELVEWWTPEGQANGMAPYTFAVNMAGVIFTPAQLTQASRAVNQGKNVRSYFTGFGTIDSLLVPSYIGLTLGQYDYQVITNAPWVVTTGSAIPNPAPLYWPHTNIPAKSVPDAIAQTAGSLGGSQMGSSTIESVALNALASNIHSIQWYPTDYATEPNGYGFTYFNVKTSSVPYATKGSYVVLPQTDSTLDADFASSVASNGNVYGALARTGWNVVEPNAPVSGVHTYNFNYFDRVIALAAAAGKKVQLYLACGGTTPSWLGTAGAQPWVSHNNSGHATNMYRPWDPVFQANLQLLITAFGARYATNPLVTCVMAWAGGRDAECYFAQTNTDSSALDALGGVSLWVNASETILGWFQTAFPNVPLYLATGVNYNTDNGASMTNVANFAMSRGIGLMTCGLKATFPTTTV
jgi:phage tail P2-like protein